MNSYNKFMCNPKPPCNCYSYKPCCKPYKKLPLHVQKGIMFRESESDTLMMPVQIDYPDDFDLNETLCEVINKTYNLK